MSEVLSNFQKKKDFLICVDSDGCAMDTMDIKHICCFGPCMVDEWQLEKWQETVLIRWNDINLYTMTRGINRFKGLAIALKEIHEGICEISGIEAFIDWTYTSPELSEAALARATAKAQERGENVDCLLKALAWSKAVNLKIKALKDDEKKPFHGVLEALRLAHGKADVVIVSSANLQAVLEEWEMYRLLQHTDIVLAQDVGSKAFCIGELLKKGYRADHVLMCGDAPGDMDAAQANSVFYFPILVRHEEESWKEFVSTGLPRLLDGSYGQGYQQERIKAFLNNLGAN